METNNPRYINPLTDFGFKKIFGNEDIMCDFLNDIVEPKSPIVKVTFLDKEMIQKMSFRTNCRSGSSNCLATVR